MTDVIRKHWESRGNCLREIALIRKQWSDRGNADTKFWDSVRKTLAFMRVWGPPDVLDLVEATREEANQRELMMAGISRPVRQWFAATEEK